MADYAPVDLTVENQVTFELNGRTRERARRHHARRCRLRGRRRGPDLLLRAAPRARRSARAGCAWSRSRACAGCRPPAARRSPRTWSCAPTRRSSKTPRTAILELLLTAPPARLPGLRQGRRVPAAGPHLQVRPRQDAVHRAQAPLAEAARALEPDRPRSRALHPLLPLRALQPGGRPGRAADHAGARARSARSPPSRGDAYEAPLHRQHRRHLPGRGADEHPVPLRRAAVGRHQHPVGLRAAARSAATPS